MTNSRIARLMEKINNDRVKENKDIKNIEIDLKDDKTDTNIEVTKTSKINSSKKVGLKKATVLKPIKYTTLDEAIKDIGYFCILQGKVVKGESAILIVNKLISKYPEINDTINGRYLEPLRLKFAYKREKTYTKKVVKKSVGVKPTEVITGKDMNKEIRVTNHQGSNLGLPSEHTYKYSSSIPGYIIDTETLLSAYIGDKQIYANSDKELVASQLKVELLGSQAINQATGKTREHKTQSGYVGKQNATKIKRNTGVKLNSDMKLLSGLQSGLISKPFTISGINGYWLIQVNENGKLILKSANLTGIIDRLVIAQINGYYCQHIDDSIYTVYDWSYLNQSKYEYMKFKDNPDITNAINGLINKKSKASGDLIKLAAKVNREKSAEIDKQELLENNKHVRKITNIPTNKRTSRKARMNKKKRELKRMLDATLKH